MEEHSTPTQRHRKFRQSLLWLVTRLSVLLLSATFLLSGFVKAVDPMGMCIKLGAYCGAWGLSLPDNALPLQLTTAALAMVEVAMGIYLLLGIRRKLTTIAVLIFMTIMSALTVYIYIYNPVADCGCFGDAIRLTHSQTLLKNIVLLAAATFLAFHPQHIVRLISERNQWITSTWTIIYTLGVTLYSFHYLPVVDFTAFSRGANLRAAWTDPASEESHTDLASFFATGTDGTLMTDSLLLSNGYNLLLTLPDERTADDGCNDRINDLADYCHDHHIAFYGLIAEEQQHLVADWEDRTGATYPFLLGESSQIKTLVRSNPGLLLLHDGRLAAKWSNNDLPVVTASLRPTDLLQTQRNTDGLLRLLLAFLVPLALVIAADALWVGSKFRKRKAIKKRILDKQHLSHINNVHTMRKKIVAGNWKMNKNLQEGVALAKELNEVLTADKPNCGVIICTPFIHLASVAAVLDKDIIGLGAENCADKEHGAYTGEVSAEMVKSTGADYVILGHSERRAYYHETPEILKEKVNLALANGLKVIFCIGEVLEDREAGRQNDIVAAQLAGSLYDLTAEQFSNIILAYEPVWAIGTGKTATAEQAEEMHAFIRQTIAEKFGAEAAENTSILYGGSCKPSNAKEIFAKPDVDGGLIGGAALKAPDFKGIIDAWK